MDSNTGSRGGSRTPGSSYNLLKARSELLGGEEGRELVIGGFPVWSRKKIIESCIRDEVTPLL